MSTVGRNSVEFTGFGGTGSGDLEPKSKRLLEEWMILCFMLVIVV